MDPILQEIIDASEDWAAPIATKVIQGDFRPTVHIHGQENRLLDDFSGDLAKHLHDKQIFNHGGNVAIVNERNYTLQRILPATFRSWVESRGGVKCQAWAKKDKEWALADVTMGEDTAKAVLVSPTFLAGIREVVRVNTVRLPVRRDNGEIELLPPGYDAQSKILTIETVTYDTEMNELRALEVFQDLLKDTAFDNRGGTDKMLSPEKMRSTAAATAMILAPYVDCMISRYDERPAFIVTANAEGAGKTMLVRMAICPIFGPMKVTPPPMIDSDKLTELLNSIAQAGSPYVVFDNWRGKIENPALEAFVTANQMGGRILGTSYTFDVEKQCLTFITGNQAIVGPDMRRRSLFVQLFVEEAKSEDRRVADPINERIILSKRGDILAACWAFVRRWQEEKCPRSQRRHLSFPEWGYMVGGILENVGYPCPLDPPAGEPDSMLQSFLSMIAGVVAGLVTDEVYQSPSELLEVCRTVGAFPWKIADTEPEGASANKERRAEGASLGRYCEIYKGRTFTLKIDGIETRVKFEAIGQGKTRRYKFTKLSQC